MATTGANSTLNLFISLVIKNIVITIINAGIIHFIPKILVSKNVEDITSYPDCPISVVVVATWFVLGMKSNFMLALIVVALPIFAIEVLSLTSLNPIKIIKGKERMELEKTITEARRRRLKSSAIDASKEDPFKKASAIASELTKDYSIGSKAKRAWKKLWE